jgi:hypothetical protein
MTWRNPGKKTISMKPRDVIIDIRKGKISAGVPGICTNLPVLPFQS